MTEPTRAGNDLIVRLDRFAKDHPAGRGLVTPGDVVRIEGEARAAVLAELRAKVEALPTHEASGNGIEWLCVPDPRLADGPMAHFSINCGDDAAHHSLVDAAAVLALLSEA